MFYGNFGNRDKGGKRRQSTNVRDLLVRGTAAAKVGDLAEARHYLEWVLRSEPTEEQRMEAWYWLSEVSADAAEKRDLLENVLARNPAHARARRAMALLDGRLQQDELVDPERIPAAADEGPRPAEADRFTCPRCAARMVFMPDGESLYCEHCAYRENEGMARPVELAEQDFIVALATARGHSRPENVQVVACEGCAAELMLDPEALSVTCPYCDATYAVRVTQTRSLIAPQGIIPMAIGGEAAQRTVDRWLDKQQVRVRAPVHGFYFPCWTFDLGGSISWRGWRYESEQQWGQKVVKEVQVSGEWPVEFDDLLVPAGSNFPERLMQAAMSYDLGAVAAYESHYLADWPAATYDLPLADASLRARKQAVEAVRERRGHKPSGVRDFRWSSSNLAVLSYKLLLLPLWIGHYRVDGRTLTVLVNGQSGRLYGETAPRKGLLGRLLG